MSHPSEISEDRADETAKSVVFILDEFDLFTTHPRQTLLYNLFDIAQAKKAPILVLGVTTRIDVVEALEKRVKSRFSHRYVHLSLPKSCPAFWDICKEGLLVEAEDLQKAGFDLGMPGQKEFVSYWHSMIEVSSLWSSNPLSNMYRISTIKMPILSTIFSHFSIDLNRLLTFLHHASFQSPTFQPGACLSLVENSQQASHFRPQTPSFTSFKGFQIWNLLF